MEKGIGLIAWEWEEMGMLLSLPAGGFLRGAAGQCNVTSTGRDRAWQSAAAVTL